MDKLAYHLNKKRKTVKIEGKCLYYYPCDPDENPDAWFGNKCYIVIEVTEQEWEALRELDRLEYNNTHKYQRHTNRISNKDEEELTPKQQQKRIDKDIPFNVLVNEQIDKEILYAHISIRHREILDAVEVTLKKTLRKSLALRKDLCQQH